MTVRKKPCDDAKNILDYLHLNGLRDKTMFCSESDSPKTKRWCEGDSGAGLVCTGSNGLPSLCGIKTYWHSGGLASGMATNSCFVDREYPPVVLFSSVAKQKNWIETKLGKQKPEDLYKKKP